MVGMIKMNFGFYDIMRISYINFILGLIVIKIHVLFVLLYGPIFLPSPVISLALPSLLSLALTMYILCEQETQATANDFSRWEITLYRRFRIKKLPLFVNAFIVDMKQQLQDE